MKKLLCLSILTLGMFVSVQAQALFYQLENVSSTETWIYKMIDSNGNTLNFATLNPNGGTATGAFNPTAFPIEWAAEDSNGCSASGIITGPGPAVYPTSTCGASAQMKYQVTTVFGGNFFLQFVFD